MPDIRAQLQAAFEAELADHLGAIRHALAAAEDGAEIDRRDVFRRAHSLKGAARAVEQPAIEAIAHDLESLLAAVEEGERALDAGTIRTLRRGLDAIEDIAAGRDAAEEADDEAATPAPAAPLHLAGQHLDRLVRSLHALGAEARDRNELAITLGEVEGELRAAAATLSGGTRQRITRAAATLQRLRRDTIRTDAAFVRAVSLVEANAERIMLVPAELLVDGFERMVREVADEQGKAAVLVASGTAAEADRRVLQGLREAVMHLLRNAISHGIEPPGRRLAAGKPEQGRVAVAIETERSALIVTVSDDGAGLDLARIEAQARATGLIAPAEPAPSPEGLSALLFEQGFSTAGKIDAIAGRGVGLAVVAAAVRRLHGSVTIAPAPGGGTAVRISVPITIARQAVLLCEAGGALYGLPAAAVERVLRVEAHEIARGGGGESIRIDRRTVPVVALATLLGLAAEAPEARRPALLLGGPNPILLTVDALSDVRALMVGDPTAIAAEVPLVFGTALLEDERVVVVLSPVALAERARRRRYAPPPPRVAPTATRTVLVVDNSITTRTLEKSILEAEGYRVRLSVDGLEALELLRAEPGLIDLVVADVEMPRLDGFGLLGAIRNDPALSRIPVVMMTSRNSPDDVQRGLELGADAYVTKQDFDQGNLLTILRQLL